MVASPVPSLTADDVLNALSQAAVVLDSDGRFVTANAGWTNFCVDHGTFMVAMRPGDDYLVLCADEARRVGEGIRAVIDRAQPRFSFTYPCRTVEGERWIRIDATPLGDGALVMHDDVGDRYAHVGQWLAGGVEAVVELDARLAPTYVSRSWQRLLGGGHWTSPLDSDALDELTDRLATCLCDHGTFAVDIPGGRRWYRIAGSAGTVDEGTAPIGSRVVLMITDITEERRAVTHAAAVDERNRLAAEVHDTVLQQLYGTALALQRDADGGAAGADTVVDTLERIDRAIGDLRALGRAESPAVGSLTVALDAVLLGAETALGYPPVVRIDVDLDRVGDETAPHLLAVLTESLSNVARHSGATCCEVTLGERAGHLLLTVADNGRGMPGKRTRASGTRNIGQRAEELGGRAMWSPGVAGGTVVTWQVPMTTQASEAPAVGD